MVSDFRPRESYQFFLQESVELLQTLEQGLLSLREDSSTQKIHNLMRTAHSIKGGAACVGLNHIKTIAHGLENIFKVLYQDGIEIDLELEGLLLEAYDRLKSPLVTEIHHGETDPAKAIANANLV
jgi:two-component system, chemotaxis family, sensor histidine kinase and response regulator PixL